MPPQDNLAGEIFNDKVVKFMTEEAGSSMYPKLMQKIKFTANRLGVKVPDRWAYEAKGNAHQRTKLQAKKAAAEASFCLHVNASLNLYRAPCGSCMLVYG